MKSNNFEKISIIIPIYNGEEYLRRCIDSIIKQTYSNLEIILVNDGSIDGTKEICDEYEEKYETIKCYHNENRGVSASRNFGFEKSSGDYIMFVDADDYLENCMVEKLYLNLTEYNVDISICNYIQTNKTKQFTSKTKILNKENLYNEIQNIDSIGTFPWNKLYKRKILNQIGKKLFDEDLFIAEDLLFLLKYMDFCERGTFTDEGLYNYNYRENSLSHIVSKKKIENSILSFERIFNKYESLNVNYDKIINIYINILITYKNELRYNKKKFEKKYNDIIKKYYFKIKNTISKKDLIKWRFKIYFYDIYFEIWKLKRRK